MAPTKGGDVEAAKDLKVEVPDGERSSPSGGNQITLERRFMRKFANASGWYRFGTVVPIARFNT